MGVYIKGMEMPTSCLSCPLQGGIVDCRLTQKTYNWGLSERPSDCPLVPVPPHGRLIDADDLLATVHSAMEDDDMYEDDYRDVRDWLAVAPTVIEAEGGGSK